jgi:NAD dependent epimerase/dehydratase family enzyme
MGEFGSILVKGQKVHPKKLLEMGFHFEFSKINEALENLLRNEEPRPKIGASC